MKKARRLSLIILGIVVAGLFLGGMWFRSQLAPTPKGDEFYIRFNGDKNLKLVLERLQERKVVRNPWALYMYAKASKEAYPVRDGTYRFRPGMAAKEILKAVRTQIRQMVRMREYYWIARNAKVLEQNSVCKASEYVALTQKPQDFQQYVKFPLPKNGTLEGYLYPDTYDLPPLYGAKSTIIKQLETFEKKVWQNLTKPKDIARTLVIASMVQLEVAKDNERPVVAGVIENRIRQGMRLQIDATALYAMQVWKNPTRHDIMAASSPYNTYLNAGLPPGPICSPSVKSILGAENPAKHAYLYYVATPQKYHLFASTLAQHNANIAIRRKLMKEAGK